MNSPKKPRTFYQRILPSTCVAFNSIEGKRQFESALHHKGLRSFFALMEQFTTQSEPAFCGISTLVMVLNSLAVDPRRVWKGPWRWYSEEMLNCCMDLEEVKEVGITFDIFACLARCQGLQVEKHFAQDHTLQAFRIAINRACVETENSNLNCLLVVSYSRKTVKQTGDGHFSPIAAFDEASDQVLILDTARFKYGAHWVPVTLIFEAMLPIDKDTQKSRGYVLLSFEQESNKDALRSMISLLVVFSVREQHFVRRRHKQFLEARQKESNGDVAYDEVLRFWTEGGEKRNLIWQSLKPQVIPVEEEDRQAVDAVRSLIKCLVRKIATPPPGFEFFSEHYKSKCQENGNRVIPLFPEEAIFILYLTLLSPEDKSKLVNYDNSIADEATRNQLLNEVKLVQIALDISEEMNEALEVIECNRTTTCCKTNSSSEQ